MRNVMVSVVLSMMASLAVLGGCHAAEDDPAGQAEELDDPVRRQHAIANIRNIYAKALADNSGDRSSEAVRAVTDATVDKLASTYVEHPEDSQNGLLILDLLKEMQDPRAIPALVAALTGWRNEVTEEHAIRAAQAILFMDVPNDKKAELVRALDQGFQKIRNTRPVDQRMRVEIIRALGALDDRSATPILTKIATRQEESQNFLINRLAAQQLGRLGDPAAVEPMIEALFLFAPGNPDMRMNDVAAGALVGIGRPALQPLLQVLAGRHERANEIAKAYVQAQLQRQGGGAPASLVADLTRQETSREATFALGALGFSDALDPLLAETRGDDVERQVNATRALVQLNMNDAQRGQVREALRRVYAGLPGGTEGIQLKAVLIAQIGHFYDPEMQSFLLGQARDRDLFAPVREGAASAFSLFANKAEAQQMRALIEAEPTSEDGGEKEGFARNEPALAAAVECDEDAACWRGKLDDSEKMVVIKAAYMLARTARGDQAAIDALVAKLNHMEIEVRNAVVEALDVVAVNGSQEAVDRIAELEQQEEGRAVWSAFKDTALPIQARLRSRLSN